MKPLSLGHGKLLSSIGQKKDIPNFVSEFWSYLEQNLPEALVGIADKIEILNAADHHGIVLIGNLDAPNLLKVIETAGFKLRYNPVDNELEVHHSALTGGEWMSAGRKTTTLSMLSNLVHSIAGQVKYIPPKKNETIPKYKFAPIPPHVWGTSGENIFNDLQSLIVENGNGKIQSVHPLREFLQEVREYRAKLSDEERKASIAFAKEWIMHIPHLMVDDVAIAKACSKSIAGGLGHRLLESEKIGAYRPIVQRDLVFLSSPHEFKIGKTAAIVSIIPPKLRNRVNENFSLESKKDMLRAIKGKFFVIADDLAGFTAKEGGLWKSFQTTTRPSVDDKYKITKEFPRVDWIAGTANEMHLPADQALISRIMVCIVKSHPESKDTAPWVRGKQISDFFDQHRMHLFTGAITIAESGEDIEIPDKLWIKRQKALDLSSSDTIEFKEQLKDVLINLWHDDCKGLLLKDIVRDMELLKFESGDKKGFSIPASTDKNNLFTDDEMERHTNTAFAIMSAKRPVEFRSVLSTLRSMGWSRKQVRNVNKRIWVYCPIDEKSFNPNPLSK